MISFAFQSKTVTTALGLTIASAVASLAFVQSAVAFTAQPDVTAIEQVKTSAPIPHTVSWESSGQAEDGTKTIDHQEMVVVDSSDSSSVCSFSDIDADTRSLTLNKSNCPELHVYGYYEVELIEVYTDDTVSGEATETFRTKPPKPKNLRAKKREANAVRLRFDRGVQIAGNYIYVDYKIARRKNRSNIVENGSTYTDDNYVEVDGLPAGAKLQARVRFRNSSYGNSPWSAWKNFSTLEE